MSTYTLIVHPSAVAAIYGVSATHRSDAPCPICYDQKAVEAIPRCRHGYHVCATCRQVETVPAARAKGVRR